MSTTNLFVELVVIGVGAAAWVCLLILAAFGHEWVPVNRLFSSNAIVPMLALVYLVGIVTDRLADTFLGPMWARGNRARIYGQDGDSYAADKALVLSDSEFARLFEYNKSRQRICRGWTFNAVAILVSLHALLWLRYGISDLTLRVGLLGSLLLLLLACGCWFSGMRLNEVQYRKVKEQAGLFRTARTKAMADEPAHRSL